jgi:acetoin utilization deacetylase AcuC-like enzyme
MLLTSCSVSAAGIIKRDEFVFENALKRKIPIVMTLAGGYQQNNARVVADSIINLEKQFNLISKAKMAALSDSHDK